MSMRFDVHDTTIEGLTCIQRKPIGDGRGYLERLFCQEELREIVGGRTIAQINLTLTVKQGTVRGMHFQHPPHAELKFVSCLRGEVFDVAVDVRRDSPTFLRWHAEVLTAGNHKTFVIPEGFAHGFQTLTENCEILYFHTAAYASTAEGAMNGSDPRLAIAWPLAITEVSDRDRFHPMLRGEFEGIRT